MKRALALLCGVGLCLAIGVQAQEGPKTWVLKDPGVWSETFPSGNPGQPGNTIAAGNGFYVLSAVLQSVEGPFPGEWEYKTVYVGTVTLFDVPGADWYGQLRPGLSGVALPVRLENWTGEQNGVLRFKITGTGDCVNLMARGEMTGMIPGPPTVISGPLTFARIQIVLPKKK